MHFTHRLSASISLVIILLLYFVFRHGWYEPSKLVLHGRATAANPLIVVRWNSGEGFNEYEQRAFRPAIQPLDEQEKNRITLGATGKQLPASLSEQVVCTAIVIDGKPFDLKKLADYGTYSNGELHFAEKQQASFTVRATSHIGIRFRTNNHSGKAIVAVNGIGKEHDLYMANEAAQFKQFDHWLLLPDGSFTVETALPRYPIHELEIMSGNPDQSVQLLSAVLHGKGQTVDLLNGRPTTLGTVRFVDVLKGRKSFLRSSTMHQNKHGSF